MSKDCRKVMQRLYHVLEGDRSDALCEWLSAHLAECSSCAGQYQVLQQLISLCRRFPQEGIPEGEKERIRENLRRSLERRAGVRRRPMGKCRAGC